jgi:nucleoside-diphosphate-sugar epimerase
MKCLVTGVAGFVGSSVADALLAEGHEVVGVDCFIDYYPKAIKLKNIEQARSDCRFRFIEDSLLNLNLNELLEGVDWIFHQAAQAGVRASWGESFSIYTENNIRATQLLLEAARNCRTLKRLVYASSSSVYGSAETLPTTEKTLPAPVSPYGVSKLAAEHLMVLYAKEFGVPTTSLRYFTVYGPRQRPDMAFNRIIRTALQNRSFQLFGDGEQTRDFTFIKDIVQANLLAAKAAKVSLVYNVGGGSRVSMNQVLKAIAEILGRPLKIERHGRAAGDARDTGADTSLLFADLGFRPATSLKDGLAREAQWLEEALAGGWYNP